MTEARAETIVENDDDFDSMGNLKQSVKTKYEDKHEDEDFLNEFNSNEDNDLGNDEDEN